MQISSPILYPLFSAEEVTFVEESLRAFRAKTVEPSGTTVPEKPESISSVAFSEDEWNKMTKEQKLSLIEADWNLSALRDIKPWVLENATVCAAMDLCAQAPEKWVTFKAACDKANMQYLQGRGQVQALTKKRKIMGKATKPLLVEGTPPGKIGLAYQMSPAVASLWKQVRSEP